MPLRVLGFALFMGGAIVVVDTATYGSIIALVTGSLLLFGIRPSTFALGAGSLIYAVIGIMIDDFSTWHKICAALGGVLLTARYLGSDDADQINIDVGGPE